MPAVWLSGQMAPFATRRSVVPSWMRLSAGLLIAGLLSSACVPVRSDPPCPPVVAYPLEVQRAAAAELLLLPEGGAVTRMLSDYAVMREQARLCRS